MTKKEIIKRLNQLGVDQGITTSDLELEMVANTLLDYYAAQKEVEKAGQVTTFKTGHTQVSAWFTTKQKAHELVLKHLKDLGFRKDVDSKPVTLSMKDVLGG